MNTRQLPATIFILAALVSWLPASGWGEKGHNAIAHIAQNHLTRRAGREITRLLEGYDMAYWSSWADGLRDDDRYDALTTWHYANADEGYTYATSPKNPQGDVYTAVNLCIGQLEMKGGSDSLRSLCLKLLIHFVGDMHCPMHAGREGDRGGNAIPVTIRGEESNLHRLWDSGLIDAAHTWSGWEWALNIDPKTGRRERRALADGTPLEWMEETVLLSHALYAATPPGTDVSWDYINEYGPLVEKKLLEAGHRLARLLNEIFG